MASRKYSGIVTLALFLIVISLILGCAKKTAEQAAGSQPLASSENIDSTPSENPADNASGAPEVPPNVTDVFGSTEQLTEDGVNAITSYGVFRFPESVLIPERSLRQYHADGTEIYRLQFGTDSPAATVADWYHNNLETGFVRNERQIATGAIMVGFEYNSPDGTWFKNITINGGTGSEGCQITVSLQRKAPDPAETPEEPS